MSFVKTKNTLLIITLVFLTLINIIQSYTTELFYDEAYYWMYSKFLNWGYFDHPPLVALYIFISDFFFAEELGVRFVTSVLFSFMIYLLWKLIKRQYPKNKKYVFLFLLIIISTFSLNLYGFITTPDTPLIFFTIIFLLSYNSILKNNQWKSYLLFSFSIVGLLYSKYMGILIVLFTVLSNLSLLKNSRFWVAIGGAIILYLPHLHWQFSNDFPSFRYHLYERFSKTSSYDFENMLLYIVNLIGLFGFTFPIVYYAFFKNLKERDTFEKCLNFIVLGFISFFFLATFVGHVQFQWTVVISIPLIIITFLFITKNKRFIKPFKWLAAINIMLIILIRFLLANEGILPVQLECHGNKEWVTSLKKEIKDKKVIFSNSYANTSIFWFYSKDTTTTYKSYYSRKNQYNLLKIDNQFVDKDVLIEVNRYQKQDSTPFLVSDKKLKRSFQFNRIKSYKPIGSLTYSIAVEQEQIKLFKKIKNKIPILIFNPYSRDISLENIETQIVLKNEKTTYRISTVYTNKKYILALSNTKDTLEFKIPNNFEKGIFFLEIYIKNNSKKEFIKAHSKLIKVKI